MASDWLQKCMRRVMVGFHVPDADQTSFPADRILSEVDPREMVRQVKQAGAQAFWFYAKCHSGNAYYPSKVGHVHSALNGRDLFGELTQACLDEGIVPGAVYEFSDHRIRGDKPEWRHQVPQLNAEGGVEMTDGVQGASIGGPCLNGPYGEFVLQQTIEVISHYPIRAYYVDFLGRFDVQRWTCPHCNERFRREFGFDFPGDARKLPHDHYVAYLRWHYRQYDEYCKRMLAEIGSVNPDIRFTHNLHGIFDEPLLQTWELAAENCDYFTHDIFALRDGTLRLSWRSRVFGDRTRRRNGAAPGEELIDSVVCTRGDFRTPKALDGYRAEMWTARACGVAAMASFVMNIDGSTDPSVFALIGRIFGEQKKIEPWLKDVRPLADVALLRSQQTIEHRPPEADAVPVTRHSVEFQGWAQVCIEAHHLWNVVQDYQLTSAGLEGYQALVLPNAACLSESQIQAVETFVRGGGALIVTGETSLFDENGAARPDFGMTGVLGLSRVDERRDNLRFLVLQGKTLKPREPWVTDTIFYHEGQWAVKPTRDLDALGDVGCALPEYSLANQVVPTEFPGLTRAAYGKGRVYYFAGLPGGQFYHYGYHTVRRAMTVILRQAARGREQATLDAPPTMELVAHALGDTGHRAFHLIQNVSGISRSTGRLSKNNSHFEMTETMPHVAEAVLRIKSPRGARLQRMYLAPNRTPLKPIVCKGGFRVRLTDLGVHTLVVAEFA